MSSDVRLMQFSPNSEYLGLCCSDGSLNIWNTSSGILKQKYTPSSHLSSGCTCISWKPSEVERVSRKTKKKQKFCSDESIIAIGTRSGSIILYSVSRGDILCHLSGAHTASVSGLSWKQNILYSCSYDCSIVEWDLSKEKVSRQWRNGHTPVQSIVAVVSDPFLISASKSLSWWNLDTLEIIQSFPGHTCDVVKLFHVPFTNENSKAGYVISVGNTDRIINIWYCTKPIQPQYSVQIATNNPQNGQVPHVVPILSCLADSDLLLVYGSFQKPVFEKFELRTMEKVTYLVRQNVSDNTFQSESRASNKGKMDEETTFLTPSQLASSHGCIKHKISEPELHQLPMEERLNALALEKGLEKEFLNTHHMANLLVQGLQSEDVRILQSVLHCEDEQVILNTVRRLPIHMIIPMLKNIKQWLCCCSQLTSSYVKWTRAVLQAHSSFLMSTDNEEVLGSLYQLIQSRRDILGQLLSLRGRLDLVLSQVSHRQEDSTMEPNNLSHLVLHDESSEEENILENILHPSESEDNWEEASPKADPMEEQDANVSSDDDELPNSGDETESC